MTKATKPIPDGYRTVTPYLVLDDCRKAMDFYKKAFGAEERVRMPGPGGKIMHAEIKVGDSMIMLSDEMPAMPGQPGTYKSPKSAGFATAALFLYVPDVDASMSRALAEGCALRSQAVDMFWGDRFGQVIDPFGLTWSFATHLEDVSPEEMTRRQQEVFAKMPQHT